MFIFGEPNYRVMGLIERLFGWDDPTDLEEKMEEKPYRCVACATSHDRQYAECPECGGQFVVEVEEGGGDAPSPIGSEET